MVAFNVHSAELLRLHQDAIAHLRAELARSETLCQELFLLLDEAYADNQQLQREIIEHVCSPGVSDADLNLKSSEIEPVDVHECRVSEGTEECLSTVEDVPNVADTAIALCPPQEDEVEESTENSNVCPPMDSPVVPMDSPVADGIDSKPNQANQCGAPDSIVAPIAIDTVLNTTIMRKLRKLDLKSEIFPGAEAEATFPNLDDLSECFVCKPTFSSKKLLKKTRKWQEAMARQHELVVTRKNGIFYTGTYTSCGPAIVLDAEGFKSLDDEMKVAIVRLTAGAPPNAGDPTGLMERYLSGELCVFKMPLMKVGVNEKVARILKPVERLPKV
ncbi:hypothetical protein DFH09DRAFT_331362 [Mycena vulgaris]|nr:hypothetical protein DFH09DRAFT_331362 [Mycena vulgaris]